MPTGMWVLYILLEVMFLERRKEFYKKKLLMYRRRWYYRHFGNLTQSGSNEEFSYHREQHLLGLEYEGNNFLKLETGILKAYFKIINCAYFYLHMSGIPTEARRGRWIP